MAQGQNNQFGLRLASCPKREVDGYGHAVPAIVALLAEQLVAAGGETVQGIFRKAPDKAECDAVKRALMTGTFTSPCTNVHVLANLLKVPTACSALHCSRCGVNFNTSHAPSTPCCLLSPQVWFRELPPNLLDNVKRSTMDMACRDDGVGTPTPPLASLVRCKPSLIVRFSSHHHTSACQDGCLPGRVPTAGA